MWGRTQSWFDTAPALSVAHNVQEPKQSVTRQFGGTAVLGMGKYSVCKESVGKDPTGLGRWTWMRFRGKNGIHTRVISVYLPNKASGDADRGVYNQHLEYFLAQGNTTCPVEQFWTDIAAEVREWMNLGDQIVLGGDWNTHIKDVNTRLADLGLSEVITTQHGLEAAPNTQNRGSVPIDGIYTNATLPALQSGYLGFGKGFTSDHRALWVDIKTDAFLGFSMEDINIPKPRRLTMKDFRVVDKYNKWFRKYALDHNLYKKAEQLLAKVQYPLSEDVQKELEAFDRLRVEGMIMAEKRCRKVRHGKHPWSPEFSRARKVVKLWNMMRARHQKRSVGARTIVRLLDKLQMRIDMSMSLTAIEAHLAKAKLEYEAVKKKAPDLRRSYLFDLAKAMAAKDKTKIASKIKALVHCEDQRRIARAIKFTTNKLFGSGTSRVIVPDGNGGNCEITDRLELERAIIRENIRKYHRAEGYCPLLQGQLLEDIGISGDGPRVPDILNGTYTCPPGTPEGTRLFIESMKRPNLSPRTKSIAERSSLPEFRAAWKRARERSSSCGPLHYGHYKAACRDEENALLHYRMAEIFMESGHYLKRHRTGVDVMLLKTMGDYRLHRLRTICLFDAEYNMNNGRVGKAGIHASIDCNELADEQYSRPCRSAIDHVVNRQLTFDYFAYMKLPYGLCSCDLAGNYDRIVHNAASLCLQRLGVPISRIHGMFNTIQRLVKRVRTTYGDSDDTYGGDDWTHEFIAPPQGVYQGNCNGPPVWSVISSTVFSILRKQGYGVKFITALSHELYHLCGFAYVDDTDLVQSGESAFHVSSQLQDALDLWNEIMNATGQAMEPSKSWWYLVDFVWERGEWKYTDGGLRNDLIAYDSDGARISLRRLVAQQASKMLGVYLSPSGNREEEVAYLKKKATDWADCIRVGHLGPIETNVALTSCIWKTIQYPLPVTQMTPTEINSIIWPILKEALPRMGINRNLPLALRYGAKRLGGKGLVNPILYQGLSKVRYLVEQPWKRTPTGLLLINNMQSLSLDCGVFGPLLSQPSHPVEWSTVKSSWLRFAWDFMSKHSITIRGINVKHLEPARSNDSALMSAISDTDAFTGPEMRKINACRLYLQVVSVSDIADATGAFVSSAAFPQHRKMPAPFVRNHYSWPQQPCPPSEYWRLWKRAITLAFCRGDSLRMNLVLGNWSQPIDLQKPCWDWFVSITSKGTTSGLWEYRSGRWYFHRRRNDRRRRQGQFEPLAIPAAPTTLDSPRLRRVTVRHAAPSIEIRSASRYDVLYPTPPSPPSWMAVDNTKQAFLDVIKSVKEGEWFVRRFEFGGDIDVLLDNLCQGDAPGVSDGSFSITTQVGTAAWILESVDRKAYIRGYCQVPGGGDTINAYRAELSGILGLTVTIWGLLQVAMSRDMSLADCNDIIVGCDGKGALNKALLGTCERISITHNHYDLLSAIRGYWEDMPCTSFPVHVEGHRDRYLPYFALSRLERMNVDMDKAAKEYLQEVLFQQTPTPCGGFQFGLPILEYEGLPISSNAITTITNKCVRQDTLSYWQRTLKLSDFEFSSVNFDAVERAFASCSTTDHSFHMKWLSGQVHTGVKAGKLSAHVHKTNIKFRCPRCGHWKDDLHHSFRCPKAKNAVNLHLDDVCDMLSAYPTHPDLIEGIRLCTTHWLRRSRVPPGSFLAKLDDQSVRESLTRQYIFSWYHFLNGIHLRSITDIQQDYFNSVRSGKSAMVWHGKFVRSLWKLSHTLYSDRQAAVDRINDDHDDDHPAVSKARDVAAQELALGRSTLPPFYASYFNTTLLSLRAKSPLSLRRWLKFIRLAREASNDPVLRHDEFSPDGIFRKWLLQK